MTKRIPVPLAVFKALEAAQPGEEIVTLVHLHARLNGPVEVCCGGRHAIKCTVLAEETRGERRKVKSKSVRVVLRKQ